MDTYEGPSREERKLMQDTLYSSANIKPNNIMTTDGELKQWQKDILSSTHGTVANDPVNHPSHYTDGKIEVIDFIEDKKLGFHLGNAVKYIARAGKKDPAKTVEDLEKAIWYIKRYIEDYKEKDFATVASYGDPDGDKELLHESFNPATRGYFQKFKEDNGNG